MGSQARQSEQKTKGISECEKKIRKIKKDGNVLVQYNHDVASVVLADVVEQNWSEIDSQYQRALATYNVRITPLGQNTFDHFGKKALFGGCFMFMDAQAPQVVRIERQMANHSFQRTPCGAAEFKH